MHDEVPIVHQNPLRRIVPFDAHRQLADPFQFLADLVGNSVRLPGIRDGADDEEIRERSNFPQIENAKVGGLFRFRRPGCDYPIWQLIEGFRRLGFAGTPRQSL